VKVEPISNGNLRIWLSQEEVDKQDCEGDVWLCLRQVLRAAQSRLSRLGMHILAELIPVAGGWVLLLSAGRDLPLGGPTVYRIADVGALCRLAEQWDASPIAHTSLYEADGGYDLAVYPAPRLSRRQTALLREYGTPIGHGEAAVACAAERGRLLAAGDALGKLLIT
jgi:hypothetical protein